MRSRVVCLAFLCCTANLLLRPHTAASEEPMPYIDNGMHTLSIVDIAVDQTGQTVVTAGGDKTLRLWDLGRRTLIQTLRLPREGFDGPLAQLAVSSDGDRLFLRPVASGSNAYEIDWRSRRLRLLTTDLPLAGAPPSVTITPQWIAGGNVWAGYAPRMVAFREQTSVGERVRAIPAPESPHSNHFNEPDWLSADRDHQGRVVTLSNRRLCLYDASARHVAEVTLPADSLAGRVRFSPDGALVAVSLQAPQRIEVRSGLDLHLLYTPEWPAAPSQPLTDVGSLHVPQIVFSVDGTLLYAGGTYSRAGRHLIRRYPLKPTGYGRFEDLPAGQGRITALAALPRGGVLFGSDLPEWGMLSADGRVVHLRRRDSADYRGSTLSIDQTGERIALHNVQTPRGSLQVALSLTSSGPAVRITRNGPSDPALRPPRTDHPDLQVDTGPISSQVLLQRERFKLPSPLRNLAAAPNGDQVIAGLDRQIALLVRQRDDRGEYWRSEWIQTTSGQWSQNRVSALNYSQDSRWFIAALADGSLRFYRNNPMQLAQASDPESLTLYVHGDGVRWVLFSPSGHYTASPGAENFIYWQVDRPAGELPALVSDKDMRARYHRPDLVARTFSRPIEAPTPSLQTANPADVPVASHPVPATGNVLSPLPNLYALLVGVSAYPSRSLRLRYPAKDAADLARLLQQQQGKLYATVTIRLLTDQQASRSAVLTGLQWLARQVTDKDVAMVFLAGHGIEDQSNGHYYYLPVDGDAAAPLQSGVPAILLREALSAIAGKVLLFLDTCHAGQVFAGTLLRGASNWSRFINELAAADNGVVVFAASRQQQAAQEDRRWGNGAFTKALLEGLGGVADRDRSGRVTLNMLDLYISERVKELTNGTQTPTTAKPASIPDFPLAVRVGH